MRMTAEEATAARAELELTTEQLAAELHVTEGEVVAWETGRIRVPKRQAERLAWLAAAARRRAALAAAHLPDCRELAGLVAALRPESYPQNRSQLEDIKRHLATCAVCRAREEYARQHLPPMPPVPVPPLVGALGAVTSAIARLPRWLRPAAWGSVIVGAIVLLRALVLLLRTGFQPELLLLVAGGIVAGAYLGAVSGLAYALARPRLRRLGRRGDYLTGIACAYAFLLAFAVPAAFLTREPMLRDPAGWALLAVMALVFGLVVGRSLGRGGGGAEGGGL